MPYQLPDGRLISAELPFTLGDVQYPPGYLKTASPEEMAALGIAWVNPAPEPEQPPLRRLVPQSVTPYQARTALRRAGLRAQAEAAIAAGGEEATDAWEYAIEIRRDSPFIAQVAAALSMTDEQVDALFFAASEIGG